MQGAYLGPEFSDLDTELMARKYKAIYHRIDDFEKIIDIVTDHLSDGKVVGWHQGRMEWGPRALGNRSILGDARNAEMQKKLNLKIKHREGFRPFAPSVIAEDAQLFFDLKTDSPYMLFIADVVENRRKSLPIDYYDLPLFARLYTPRSDVQSITHLDFSARIQTVHKDTNPRYHRLISRFKEKTGFGAIVNTSFNVRGEPSSAHRRIPSPVSWQQKSTRLLSVIYALLRKSNLNGAIRINGNEPSHSIRRKQWNF